MWEEIIDVKIVTTNNILRLAYVVMISLQRYAKIRDDLPSLKIIRM